MEKCNKCANKISKNDLFCSNCGNNLKEDGNVIDRSLKMKRVSITLGVIGIIFGLTLVFSAVGLIVSIIGLILAVIAHRSKKNVSGIILSSIGFCISLIAVIAVVLYIEIYVDDKYDYDDRYDYIYDREYFDWYE